jgi:hypothetical protein
VILKGEKQTGERQAGKGTDADEKRASADKKIRIPGSQSFICRIKNQECVSR